jgi:hypothetical protein
LRQPCSSAQQPQTTPPSGQVGLEGSPMRVPVTAAQKGGDAVTLQKRGACSREESRCLMSYPPRHPHPRSLCPLGIRSRSWQPQQHEGGLPADPPLLLGPLAHAPLALVAAWGCAWVYFSAGQALSHEGRQHADACLIRMSCLR